MGAFGGFRSRPVSIPDRAQSKAPHALGSDRLRHFLSGSFWLFLDRFFRMGLGFLVGVVLARHYGPSGYGVVNYAIAVAGIFGCLASFGLDEIIPRDLAAAKTADERTGILRAGIIVRFSAECIAYLLLIFYLLTMRKEDSGVALFTVCLGGYFLLQFADIGDFQLRSRGQYRQIALFRMTSSLVASLVKVGIVLAGLPLVFVAYAMLLEYLLNAVWFFPRARIRSGSLGFSHAYLKDLLPRALLMTLASFLVALQGRIDGLLIEAWLGLEALGRYAAISKVVGLLDIVGIVFSVLLVPEFARNRDRLPQLARMAYLVGFVIYLCLFPVFPLIEHYFPMVYGEAYQEGLQTLVWLACKPLLLIISVVRAGILVTEERYELVPASTGLAVLLSLVAFFPLVNTYGLKGAAMASVLGLFVAQLIVDVFFNRRNLVYLLSSPIALFELLRLRKA